MYGKCGCVDEAVKAFERISRRNVYSWSILIGAHAQNGHYHEAIHLFRRMQQSGVLPNQFTLSIALHACCSGGVVSEGKKIHAALDACHLQLEYVGTALVVLYGKYGDIVSAEKVFSRMPRKDPASWTAMVTAYAENGYYQTAMDLVHKILAERVLLDAHAFVVTIDACAVAGDIHQGKLLHSLVSRTEFVRISAVANALMNMYGRCGYTDDARDVFDRIVAKDVVSWTTMIAAYVQNGDPWPALDLFHKMELEPDQITYAAVLEACGMAGALLLGREIHARLTSQCNNRVSSALIKMYGQLGCVEEAEVIFCSMKSPDVVSLSAIIGVLAQSNDSGRASEIFRQMQQQGLKPNAVTYINNLSVCTQAGLLLEACEHYSVMEQDYGVQSGEKHVVCLIDIFSKLGLVEQAESLCRELQSCGARIVASSILLAACQLHGDVTTGLRAAKLVLEVELKSAVHYVAFSNMIAGPVKSAVSEAVSVWEESD